MRPEPRLTELFPDYQKINWKRYVDEIQRKQDEKDSAGERTTTHLHTLQTQLEQVREEQRRLSATDIPENTRQMIHSEYRIEQLQKEMDENQRVVASIRSLLFTDFEKNYAYLCELPYDQLKHERGQVSSQKRTRTQEAGKRETGV